MHVPDPDRPSGGDITARRLRRDHAAALVRLADVLLDDGGIAGTAIVEAVIADVLDEGARPHDPPTRAELSERVLLRCRRTSPLRAPSPVPVTRASVVERHQRAAVALYVFGHLSPQRIGRLLNLGPRSVCVLLLQDLDHLAEHDRRPATRRPAW